MMFTKAVFLALIAVIAITDMPVEGSNVGTSSNFRKQDRRKAEEHGHHEKIGLAMNGAAFVSSSGCAALMRGFQRQTLMINGEERPGLEVFDVMSSLSGGNVPNMVYHYAKSANVEELLDLDTPGYTDPSKITEEDLEIAFPAKSMFDIFIRDPTPLFLMALIHASVFGGPLWPTIMSIQILQRIGINIGTSMSNLKIRDDVKSTPIFEASMIGPSDFFPDWVDTHINRKVFGEYNNESATVLNMVPSPWPDAPVVGEQNNTYLYSLAAKHGFQVPLPAFGTDKEFHVPFLSDAVTMDFDAIGNKTVDPVVFKGFVASYDELSTASDPFTAEKMLGMATDMSVLSPTIVAIVPPSYRNVPISVNVPTADGGRRDMAFTDGGYNDGTGLPGLVQQGVRKIVSFFVPSLGDTTRTSYYTYFGVAVPGVIPPEYFTAAQQFGHIFKNERVDDITPFEKILDDLQKLKEAGEPMIATLEVEVIDNPFFGIKGGWTLELTIVAMYSVPSKFVDLLPAGVAEPPIGQNRTYKDFQGNTRFTNEEFTWVPNYPVNSPFASNYTYFIPGTDEEIELNIPSIGYNLPIKPTRMTELMLTWCVERAWDSPLIGSDGEVKFHGFKKLLEKEERHEDPTGSDSSGSNTIKNSSIFIYCLVFMISAAFSIL